ncbi:zinc-dependent alcohol dehydrogenase family protein [Aquisediminimonas profunda]|uniref:zinc-dependent alcohol dehydrogenase family protein n=1 Tax=Aquisediminimonas profunda TaxID=1550733 RepID=UPI001C633674|nr:NAD(P)-dependent alcohol dehydrogenase [Aquisediminimonas profunda]
MKAFRFADDFKSLKMHEEEPPEVGPLDVLIRVSAVSLNFRDQAILKGAYPSTVGKNIIPVSDGVGEVVAVGDAVTRAKIGDRVSGSCMEHWIAGPYLPDYLSRNIGITCNGWLAEYALIHENAVVQVPAYLSDPEVAALPCAAVSAWSALHVGGPLRPGHIVLIQGTGGVALAGLQIAKMFNARVLAITSTNKKADMLKEMGAETVVNYREYPDWHEEILRQTNGRGVDKVVEIAGEATIVKSVASTRIGGAIGLVGFTSGFGGGLPPIDILARTVTISGIGIGPRLNFEALLDAMEISKPRPVIDSVFPLSGYAEAYRHLERSAHIGKIVINVRDRS